MFNIDFPSVTLIYKQDTVSSSSLYIVWNDISAGIINCTWLISSKSCKLCLCEFSFFWQMSFFKRFNGPNFFNIFDDLGGVWADLFSNMMSHIITVFSVVSTLFPQIPLVRDLFISDCRVSCLFVVSSSVKKLPIIVSSQVFTVLSVSSIVLLQTPLVSVYFLLL